MSTAAHRNTTTAALPLSAFQQVGNLQPEWTIVSLSPEGTHHDLLHGSPGEWTAYSHVVEIDGLPVYQLHEKAIALLVQSGPTLPPLVLTAPEPVLFFSFARHRSQVSLSHAPDEASQWLFSVFGYTTSTQRVYLTVLPSHSEYHAEARQTPFLLL